MLTPEVWAQQRYFHCFGDRWNCQCYSVRCYSSHNWWQFPEALSSCFSKYPLLLSFSSFCQVPSSEYLNEWQTGCMKQSSDVSAEKGGHLPLFVHPLWDLTAQLPGMPLALLLKQLGADLTLETWLSVKMLCNPLTSLSFTQLLLNTVDDLFISLCVCNCPSVSLIFMYYYVLYIIH